MTIKSLRVTEEVHREIKWRAAKAGRLITEFGSELLIESLKLKGYVPDEYSILDLLERLQTMLGCSKEEDLFKLLWVELGQEWPPK